MKSNYFIECDERCRATWKNCLTFMDSEIVAHMSHGDNCFCRDKTVTEVSRNIGSWNGAKQRLIELMRRLKHLQFRPQLSSVVCWYSAVQLLARTFGREMHQIKQVEIFKYVNCQFLAIAKVGWITGLYGVHQSARAQAKINYRYWIRGATCTSG